MRSLGEVGHMRRFVTLAVLLASLLGSVLGAVRIPKAPADGSLLFDGAGVLEIYDRERIGRAQQALSDHGVPMGVATVPRLSRYGAESDIEAFTRQWAQGWQLDSDGVDHWVMVLVSVGDRKARIQLGPGWDEGFDRVCGRIMLDGMVPRFKEGRYHDGLIFGTERLEEALSEGLVHGPPKLGPVDAVLERFRVFESVSIFPPPYMAGLTGVGFLLLVLALFSGQGGGAFLAGFGLLTIGLACFGALVGPVLGVAFLLFLQAVGGGGRHRYGGYFGTSNFGGGSSSFGGSSFGGGSFRGGGSSGGGGATGSW